MPEVLFKAILYSKEEDKSITIGLWAVDIEEADKRLENRKRYKDYKVIELVETGIQHGDIL